MQRNEKGINAAMERSKESFANQSHGRQQQQQRHHPHRVQPDEEEEEYCQYSEELRSSTFDEAMDEPIAEQAEKPPGDFWAELDWKETLVQLSVFPIVISFFTFGVLLAVNYLYGWLLQLFT